METKLKDYMYKYYKEQNYNCAETILRAGNDYYGLNLHEQDMVMVGAFGGGIQIGSTCGAVLSAVAVLSMKYIESKAHDSSEIQPVVKKLMHKFNERYGSTYCKEIKAQSFDPELKCQRTIETACDILEETIDEYESEKNKETGES